MVDKVVGYVRYPTRGSEADDLKSCVAVAYITRVDVRELIIGNRPGIGIDAVCTTNSIYITARVGVRGAGIVDLVVREGETRRKTSRRVSVVFHSLPVAAVAPSRE